MGGKKTNGSLRAKSGVLFLLGSLFLATFFLPWKNTIFPYVFGVPEQISNIDHFPISYYEAGEGDELVLLLHGMGGDAFTSWFQVIQPLGEKYHVVAPNLFFSTLDQADYRIAMDVELVKRLLKQKTYKKLYVVALSLGSLVALELPFSGIKIDKAVYISPFARNVLGEADVLRQKYGESPDRFFDDIFYNPFCKY